MDVIKKLKGVNTLSQYIFAKDVIINLESDIILNMPTILSLKRICPLEIEYYEKYQAHGVAFIILEHLLYHPPSESWNRLGREMISIFHYLLHAFWKRFTRYNYWWTFLESLLKFIKAITLKHTCLPDILIEEVGECLLDLSTNIHLEFNQRQEIIRCLNLCSGMCSIETKIKIRDQFGNYFTKLCIEMAKCGHFPSQYIILDTLLHWLPRRQELQERQFGAKWFPKNLYREDIIKIFLEKTWKDVFQNARQFLNSHNARNNFIISEVCKSISIEGTILNFVSETCWLDINLKTKCISVLLKPDMLEQFVNIDVTDQIFYSAFIISAENITSARLYRDSTSTIALSITTSCAPRFEPTIKDAFKGDEHNVKVCMPIKRLARIDKALIDIFGNKYQLRDKLAALPSCTCHKETQSVCTHHNLSSVTERTEPTSEEGSHIALKQRQFGVFWMESIINRKSFKRHDNSSISPKTIEYPFVNTDVNMDDIDLLTYVTMRDKSKHQQFEINDIRIIDNIPIMECDGNRNITNINNNESCSEKNNRKFNMPAITGCKELIVKVSRDINVHTKKSALQELEKSTDKEEDGNCSTTNKINYEFNSVETNTKYNTPPITGCKELVKVSRKLDINTKKSAFQEINQNINKEDKPKIKGSIRKGRNTTEVTLLGTFQNTNNNIVDKIADSPITRRKRKLYSPKMENTYMEIDKPIATENDSDSLAVSNKRQPHYKIFKSKISSVISPRSQNLNQTFDALRKISDSLSNEKINLVDKNRVKQIYNYTSDSEDEDFRVNKMNLRSAFSLSRTGKAESTKHSRANNHLNYAEKQLGSPKDKAIKKAKGRPRKKFVKPKTGVELSKSNTVPRTEIIDEIMRTAPSETINTSTKITTRHRTMKKEPEPITQEIRMEPMVETIISGKKQSKKKNSTGKALKNKKVVKKTASSLIIKNNEDDKSTSPLPELVSENVTATKNDSDDSLLVKNIMAWRKMYNDSGYDNAENQNDDCDISKINNTLCDTVNHALVIDVDKEDIIESHHTIEEKQKEAIQCNISKVKKPNIEDASSPDKSMVTDGDWSETAYLHSYRKPPSISLLEEKIKPRDLELQDVTPAIKKCYVKLRRIFYHTSDLHISPVKDNEKEKKDDRERRKSVRRLSRRIEKPSLLENVGFNENNKTVAHKTQEISKHDKKKESFIISSRQSVNSKHEVARGKKSRSKLTMDKKTDNSKYKSIISPINLSNEIFIPVSKKTNIVNDDNVKPSTSQQFLYDSKDAQLRDANRSVIINGEEIYSPTKESSVGNAAASAESNNSAKYEVPKLARKRARTYELIRDRRTAIENSEHKIRKTVDNTAINRWLEHNTESTAKTPKNDVEEMIEACLEKIETALVALDDGTHMTLMQLFSAVTDQLRKAALEKQYLLRDLEQKFIEIDNQTQEALVNFSCNIIHEYSNKSRKTILELMNRLEALNRLISKKA